LCKNVSSRDDHSLGGGSFLKMKHVKFQLCNNFLIMLNFEWIFVCSCVCCSCQFLWIDKCEIFVCEMEDKTLLESRCKIIWVEECKDIVIWVVVI